MEQGSSRVLQAVDWPQSSPEGEKNQDSQDIAAETPRETGSAREVCISACNKAKLQLGQAQYRMHLPCHERDQGRMSHCGVTHSTLCSSLSLCSAGATPQLCFRAMAGKSCLSVQGEAQVASQKRKWWLLSKAKQGFQQLQKLNLAFQDWTERFWKANRPPH